MDLLFGADAPILARSARKRFDELKAQGVTSAVIYHDHEKAGAKVEHMDA